MWYQTINNSFTKEQSLTWSPAENKNTLRLVNIRSQTYDYKICWWSVLTHFCSWDKDLTHFAKFERTMTSAIVKAPLFKRLPILPSIFSFNFIINFSYDINQKVHSSGILSSFQWCLSYSRVCDVYPLWMILGISLVFI